MNLKEFLTNNIKNNYGAFALVKYNDKAEVIWFSVDNRNNTTYFYESKCIAIKKIKVSGNIDFFCKEYMSNNIILPHDTDKNEYIDKYIKPFIKNGWLYDVESCLSAPFLPKDIKSIKLISKEESLDYLINDFKS